MECWVDIAGFEGRYQVSDLGRVRSLDHHVRIVRHGVEGMRLVHGRILRPGASKSGHLSVAIGKGNSRQVHQLVLEAFFIGPLQPGVEALHLNHTPSDNRLVNLRYGTRSENVLMDYAAGSRTVNLAQLEAARTSRWARYREARA